MNRWANRLKPQRRAAAATVGSTMGSTVAILAIGLFALTFAGCGSPTDTPADAAPEGDLQSMLAEPTPSRSAAPATSPATPGSRPPQVAMQTPPPVGNTSTTTLPGATVTPKPTAITDAAAALNPQAVSKIVEDNISLREEIRRLKIERENLIRLLRTVGENYTPPDDPKSP